MRDDLRWALGGGLSIALLVGGTFGTFALIFHFPLLRTNALVGIPVLALGLGATVATLILIISWVGRS